MNNNTDQSDEAMSGQISPGWLACPSCDRLFDVDGLADGDSARCSNCNHFLTQYRRDGLVRSLAYSVAAMVFFFIACSFPFMSFRSSGLESVMTLLQTVIALYKQGMPDLALMIAGFTLIVPVVVLMLVVLVTVALWARISIPGLRSFARILFFLQGWSMTDVFLVGVIVSLVKLMDMATVIVGVSFWAYAAFAVCFALTLTGMDRYRYWRLIEEIDI